MSGVTLDMERRIVVIPGAVLNDVTVAPGRSITLVASESGGTPKTIKVVSMQAGKGSSVELSEGRFEIANSSFHGELSVNSGTTLKSSDATALKLPIVASTGQSIVTVEGCRIVSPLFGLGKILGADPSLVRS
jgi:hypothetical protein